VTSYCGENFPNGSLTPDQVKLLQKDEFDFLLAANFTPSPSKKPSESYFEANNWVFRMF
jgi:hypothetical protein